MDLLFTKAPVGLIPACEEAQEWLKRKKLGSTILVEPREPRNGAYFRKWWALVQLGYDYWSEMALPLEYKGEPVKPDFDRFRRDLTILAGFYKPVANLKGEVRARAGVAEVGKHEQERFEETL